MPSATNYNPNPVPSRTSQQPSIRDDVRRMLLDHDFRPHDTLYTHVRDIYELFLLDTAQTDTPQLEGRFRSALGRVLRPPRNAGTYAMSFAADITRCNGMLSITSPNCKAVNPRTENREYKRVVGERCRAAAGQSTVVTQLRQERRQRKEDHIAEEELTREISFRYVDEFMSLHCAVDMLAKKVFPNGKEMAESMSAFDAVREYLHVHNKSHEQQDGILSFKDPNVLLLAVGDGVTPRTAAMFAFRTSWRCVSIDPMMRSGAWDNITNLKAYKSKVEDMTVSVSSEPFERVVVVMWHCHVSIADSLRCLEFDNQKWNVKDKARSAMLRERVSLVTCACCNYDGVQKCMPDGSSADEEYEDIGVPGLMRTVRVWKFKKPA